MQFWAYQICNCALLDLGPQVGRSYLYLTQKVLGGLSLPTHSEINWNHVHHSIWCLTNVTFPSPSFIHWSISFLNFSLWHCFLMSLICLIKPHKEPLYYMQCACVLRCFSRVQVFMTLWTVAHQASLSMGILQARILELPCPPPEDLLNPGIKPASLMSPALAGEFFTTSTTWEAPLYASM